MVFEVATEKFRELKTFAEPHLNCLTRLLALEAWPAPDCLLQVIEKLPEDQAILEKGIHQFALICKRDLSSTKRIIEDLAKYLGSSEALYRMSVGNIRFKTFPGLVPLYFTDANACFNSLLQQLRLETKKTGKYKGEGTIFIDSPASISMKVANASLTTPVMDSNPSVAAAASSSEAAEPLPEPPATATAVMAPPATGEFRLPPELEQLGLKPAERELFIRVLSFCQEERLSYRMRIYAILVAKLDIILNRYMAKGQLDIRLDRLCGGNSKTGRRARDFRCLYQNSDSKVSNDFKLKGTDPDFEEEVRALRN